MFYLKQKLSRTTTNLRIFSKIIGNKFKEQYEENIDKNIKQCLKFEKNFEKIEVIFKRQFENFIKLDRNLEKF